MELTEVTPVQLREGLLLAVCWLRLTPLLSSLGPEPLACSVSRWGPPPRRLPPSVCCLRHLCQFSSTSEGRKVPGSFLKLLLACDLTQSSRADLGEGRGGREDGQFSPLRGVCV